VAGMIASFFGLTGFLQLSLIKPHWHKFVLKIPDSTDKMRI